MGQADDEIGPLLCPSAQPEMTGSVIFGVVRGTVEAPRVEYLKEPVEPTDEVLALVKPVAPTEVFRFAGSCAGTGCAHFDGSHCRLVRRMVQLVPEATDVLPPCPIRSRCRWWHEEGKAACFRCPQVVTEHYGASEQLRRAADPTS